VADDRWFTRRFLLASVANFVFFCAVTSFFSLPVHLEQLGASRAEIGRVMGIFGFASLVAIPATGVLVDRFGRRPFLLSGALGWIVLSLLFVLPEGLGVAFYVLRIAQGVSFSLAFVAMNALLVDLAPPGRLGRAIALFGATTLVAHAVGPALGEQIAIHWGFHRLFELVALDGLVAFALFALVGRGEVRPASRERAMSMLGLALRPGARSALLGGLMTAVAFGTAIHFMPVFVRARGMSSHAPFFLTYVVAAIAVRFAAGGLSDRVGHRRVGVLSALVFSGSVMGFSGVNGTAALVLWSLLFGVSHGLAYPSLNALFVEGAPDGTRGRAMALFNLSFNVGITVAAFAAGEIAERSGYGAMWAATGAAVLLGVVGLLVDRTGPSQARDV